MKKTNWCLSIWAESSKKSIAALTCSPFRLLSAVSVLEVIRPPPKCLGYGGSDSKPEEAACHKWLPSLSRLPLEPASKVVNPSASPASELLGVVFPGQTERVLLFHSIVRVEGRTESMA